MDNSNNQEFQIDMEEKTIFKDEDLTKYSNIPDDLRQDMRAYAYNVSTYVTRKCFTENDLFTSLKKTFQDYCDLCLQLQHDVEQYKAEVIELQHQLENMQQQLS